MLGKGIEVERNLYLVANDSGGRWLASYIKGHDLLKGSNELS